MLKAVAVEENGGKLFPSYEAILKAVDGYRNVIKIILDIATRMCILNPYLKGEALKKTPGIVLIDEIDLSLHPT